MGKHQNRPTRHLVLNGLNVVVAKTFYLGAVTGTVQAIGDFNGDSLADLIVRDSLNGNMWVLTFKG
jgi:hypothetical protein